MLRALNSDVKKLKIMVLHGFKRALIAKRLGITEAELVERYGSELKKAHAEGKAMTASHLFRSAVGGDLGAICHWLKTRAGWSESARARAQEAREAKAVAPPARKSGNTFILPCNSRACCWACGPKEFLVGLKDALPKIVAEAEKRSLDLTFERPANVVLQNIHGLSYWPHRRRDETGGIWWKG